MGNRITSTASGDTVFVKMNNNLTGVVLSLLAITGTALAATEREEELVVWLASRDQAIYGRGAVGFDLSDLPWTVEQFEAEKRFLLNVVAATRAQTYWSRLGYEITDWVVTSWIMPRLETLEQMLERFPKAAIKPEIRAQWLQIRPTERLQCPRHTVFLNHIGCLVCHDQGFEPPFSG